MPRPVFLLLPLLALACTVPVSAQTSTSPRTIVVGAASDHYPYSYRDERGELTGFAVDILDAVAMVRRLAIRRVILPAREIGPHYQAGKFAALQLFSYAGTRAAGTGFSAPYITLQGMLFVRDSERSIHSVSDLHNRSVLVGGGSTGEAYLRRVVPTARLVPDMTLEENFRGLVDGRGDAVLTSRLSGLATLSHMGIRRVVPTGVPIDDLTVHFCFGSHDDAVLVELNEGLATLFRTGQYERIYRRWFGRYEPASISREDLAHYGALALALLLAGAFWTALRQVRLHKRLAAQASALREKDAELSMSRRLRAVGEMVGGIAHEFNNLLTPIVLKVELLREDRTSDAHLQRELQVIAGAAERAATLTRRLLTFGRQTNLEPSDVHLSEVVTGNLDLLRHACDPRIEMVCDLAPDLPPLRVNPSDVHQIVINLLINARDTLQEKLDAAPADWQPRLEVVSRADGPDWQRLIVRDNGMGIPSAVVDRIFEPFFSTKGVGRGTGLGLATVWHLIQTLSGRIDVDSIPGGGTAFHVWLPCRAAAAAGMPTPSRAAAVSG